jgi:hypothetical protein
MHNRSVLSLCSGCIVGNARPNRNNFFTEFFRSLLEEFLRFGEIQPCTLVSSRSISSRVLPFVSGTRRYTKKKPTKQTPE